MKNKINFSHKNESCSKDEKTETKNCFLLIKQNKYFLKIDSVMDCLHSCNAALSFPSSSNVLFLQFSTCIYFTSFLFIYFKNATDER